MGWLDQARQFAVDVHRLAYQGVTAPGSAGSSGGVNAPQSYPLVGETRSVTLSSSGNGTARWSPGQPATGGGVGAARRSGYSVDVTSVVVSVAPLSGNTTPIQNATATAYIGYGIQSTNAADSKGATFNGSLGGTLSFTGRLLPGDWITIVWTGGDVGAIATMTVNGTANPPGSN
jgi:hypothetical protein